MDSYGKLDLDIAYLDATLTTIIIFLGVLVAQLLYSLILADVDQKTYTFGMLRALGMRKERLVALITIQSTFFSIPGLLSGIIVAFTLNTVVRFIIFQVSFNYTDYRLGTAAIILALFFGIIVPLLANILPTYKALGKNLRNSLDMNHRAQDGVSVK
jgi:ABC-type antimicrobial peptide transport system permease subunit